MRAVTSHAAPLPASKTPSAHAWPVKSGSLPMVRSKAHAAMTDTANCNQITRLGYTEGGSYLN